MELLKVKPWGKNQGGFVLIESSSFNEDLHELYDENEDNNAGLSEEEAMKFLSNLDGLNAKDLKKLCGYFEIEYSNKADSITAIKLKTEGGE